MIELTKENVDILEHCAGQNPESYNLLKALEEATEFSEVILKIATKHPKNKKRPPLEDAIDEYGDMLYRGLIHLMDVFPEDSIEEIQKRVTARINKKLANLAKYKTEGSYQGGL